MNKRINVVLPVETLKVLDRVAPRGNRSRLISEAVLHYVESRAKSNLADRLKAGALANAKRDLEIAQEWFSLDEEAWRRTKQRSSWCSHPRHNVRSNRTAPTNTVNQSQLSSGLGPGPSGTPPLLVRGPHGTGASSARGASQAAGRRGGVVPSALAWN